MDNDHKMLQTRTTRARRRPGPPKRYEAVLVIPISRSMAERLAAAVPAGQRAEWVRQVIERSLREEAEADVRET